MVALMVGLLMVTASAFHAAHASEPRTPHAVLKTYLAALYSRDAVTAYALVSAADREVKTAKDYVAETGAFTGPALILARELSHAIRYENLETIIAMDRATVTFEAVLPNANGAALSGLVGGFDSGTLANLHVTEIDMRAEQIRAMARSGDLPVIRSHGESWNLVREDGEWRVFLNWAEAVEVTFRALTFHDLGWEFTPVRDRVMAKHGETVQMAYRARNIGAMETTGKARHIVGPNADAGYLEIIACFCFLEQTLAPGEEVTLPLVFRVGYDAPEELKAFNVRYEFYPADRFPRRDVAARRTQ